MFQKYLSVRIYHFQLHVLTPTYYLTPVRDLWCVCTWLVVHMYMCDGIVMNARLMHPLTPLGPCCSCLKVLCKVEYYLLYSCTWPMMSVYMTYDVVYMTQWQILVAYWLKHWTTDRKIQGSSPTSSRDLFLLCVHSAYLKNWVQGFPSRPSEGTLSRWSWGTP